MLRINSPRVAAQLGQRGCAPLSRVTLIVRGRVVKEFFYLITYDFLRLRTKAPNGVVALTLWHKRFAHQTGEVASN